MACNSKCVAAAIDDSKSTSLASAQNLTKGYWASIAPIQKPNLDGKELSITVRLPHQPAQFAKIPLPQGSKTSMSDIYSSLGLLVESYRPAASATAVAPFASNPKHQCNNFNSFTAPNNDELLYALDLYFNHHKYKLAKKYPPPPKPALSSAQASLKDGTLPLPEPSEKEVEHWLARLTLHAQKDIGVLAGAIFKAGGVTIEGPRYWDGSNTIGQCFLPRRFFWPLS